MALRDEIERKRLADAERLGHHVGLPDEPGPARTAFLADAERLGLHRTIDPAPVDTAPAAAARPATPRFVAASEGLRARTGLRPGDDATDAIAQFRADAAPVVPGPDGRAPVRTDNLGYSGVLRRGNEFSAAPGVTTVTTGEPEELKERRLREGVRRQFNTDRAEAGLRGRPFDERLSDRLLASNVDPQMGDLNTEQRLSVAEAQGAQAKERRQALKDQSTARRAEEGVADKALESFYPDNENYDASGDRARVKMALGANATSDTVRQYAAAEKLLESASEPKGFVDTLTSLFDGDFKINSAAEIPDQIGRLFDIKSQGLVDERFQGKKFNPERISRKDMLLLGPLAIETARDPAERRRRESLFRKWLADSAR